MKFGSADWNLWPLGMEYETTFPLFKDLGIRSVELGIYEPSQELGNGRGIWIVDLAHKYDLEISAALFSLTPENWPDGALSNNRSNFLEEFVNFTSELANCGIDHANVWTGADLPNSDLDQTRTSLKFMDRIAALFPGTVSIEYKAGTIFPDGKALAEILSAFNNLKVLVDTGHSFALEEDVVQLILELHSKGLLGALHLGDATAGDSDADLPCGRIHDFAPIVEALHKIDFEGPANFDLYGAAIEKAGPGPIRVIQESLVHLVSKINEVSKR